MHRVIIPTPKNKNIYYLFTCRKTTSIYHSQKHARQPSIWW